MTSRRRARKPYPTLQAWMDANGYDQLVAARKLGISNSFLCNILKRRRACSMRTAIRIAAIANIPVEHLADLAPSKCAEVA